MGCPKARYNAISGLKVTRNIDFSWIKMFLLLLYFEIIQIQNSKPHRKDTKVKLGFTLWTFWSNQNDYFVFFLTIRRVRCEIYDIIRVKQGQITLLWKANLKKSKQHSLDLDSHTLPSPVVNSYHQLGNRTSTTSLGSERKPCCVSVRTGI